MCVLRLAVRVKQPPGGISNSKIELVAAAAGQRRTVSLQVTVPLPRPELTVTPTALRLARRHGAQAHCLLECAPAHPHGCQAVEIPKGCIASVQPFGAAWRLTLTVEDEKSLGNSGRLVVGNGAAQTTVEVSYDG